MSFDKEIKDRLVNGIKKYLAILIYAEYENSDEVEITKITNRIISEVFCFKNEQPYFIQCKAIYEQFTDDEIKSFNKQAVEKGFEWTVLTNGADWKIYKSSNNVLVYQFNFLNIYYHAHKDLLYLYYLCKESFPKNAASGLDDLYMTKKVLNPHVIADVLLSDKSLDNLRKELKKFHPELYVTLNDLSYILKNEIFDKEITDKLLNGEAQKIIKS